MVRRENSARQEMAFFLLHVRTVGALAMRRIDELPHDAGAYRLRVETTLETMRRTRKLVRSAALAKGASDAAAADIELAVGEALANAYEHAYGGEAGPVNVTISCDGKRFVIEIRNHGRPVTPPVIPTQAPTGERGRGLFIIRRIMDEVKVMHPVADGRGTALLMAKRIG